MKKKMITMMKKTTIKKILRKIDWFWDYYFAWFFYNGNKTHRYIEYMEKKWRKTDEL